MSDLSRTVDDSIDMSPFSVVVVDDDQNILHSLKRLTRREPYSLICVNSGAEALKLLEVTPQVAVIISDQRMPVMNGTDFLVKSRKLAPLAVRMLLTGYSDIETTVAAMNEGGATRYISKPWLEEELLQTIQGGIRHYYVQQLHMEQKIEFERLAMTDTLTGLSNRRHVLECLEKECLRSHRYGCQLSLIMFDIDNFKHINDLLGHAAGDDVLRKIAKDTNNVIRISDIAGRYGGDEFVILLPESNLSDAISVASRLLQSVVGTPIMQNHESIISVSVSIGVALFGPYDSPMDLINRADQAMYRAKKNGRNRVEVLDFQDDQEES